MSPRRIAAFALSFTLLGASSLVHAQEREIASVRASASPSDPPSQLRLGRTLRRAGRYEEAVRALRLAARGPIRNEALFEIARVRFDQGSVRASQAACNALPNGRTPRDPNGLLKRICLARAHLVWQRTALADREIDVARRIQPDHGELRLVIADAARMSGRMQVAEENYRAAATALSGRAEPHLGLGLLYESSQRYDEALAALRRATESDPGDPVARLALGRFLLKRRNDGAGALALLQRASEDRPDWPDALVALGDAQLATNDGAGALESFQHATRLSATHAGAQSGLGRARLRLNQLAEAEAPLRRALEQVANDAEAHMALAELLARTERTEDALEEWNRAIELMPADLTPRMRAAQLARSIGQNALARAYLDRIFSDDPNHAPALLMRADIAFDDNDRNTARQLYQQALSGRGGAIDRAHAQRRIQEIDAPQRRIRRR